MLPWFGRQTRCKKSVSIRFFELFAHHVVDSKIFDVTEGSQYKADAAKPVVVDHDSFIFAIFDQENESCPWIDLTQPSTVSFVWRLRSASLDGSPMDL